MKVDAAGLRGCSLRSHRQFAPGELLNFGFDSSLPSIFEQKSLELELEAIFLL